MDFSTRWRYQTARVLPLQAVLVPAPRGQISSAKPVFAQVCPFALFDGLRRHGGVESRGPAPVIADLPKACQYRGEAPPNPWTYSRTLQEIKVLMRVWGLAQSDRCLSC